MADFQIIRANTEDLSAINKLLLENSLPTSEMQSRLPLFFVAKDDEKIVGVVGVDVHKQVALLCSFAVDTNYRKKGIGRQLYNQALIYCNGQDVKDLYLLTTTASDYFSKLGWIRIKRDQVPDAISKTAEFSSICPDSAVCMYFPLSNKLVKKALKTFSSNFNCAQSVLVPWSGQLGFDAPMALKLATGFGGGIASKGETCGVVSGAYMAIGLKYGKSSQDDVEAKEITLAKIEEFDKKFLARHGALHCKSLLKADMSIPEEKEKLIQQDAFNKICPEFVKDATTILETILD